MSKERLEGIREDVGTNARKEYEFITTILLDDALWLIEQAERVQNLESRLAFEQGVTSNLQSKNKRYREALEEIIRTHDLWQIQYSTKAGDYKVEVARKVLECEE